MLHVTNLHLSISWIHVLMRKLVCTHACFFMHHTCLQDVLSKKICIHATDTDVLVLAIASKLSTIELWLAFGHGNHFCYISAHDIAHKLGSVVSQGLPFFHALTGCDTVSSFSHVGKRNCLEYLVSFTCNMAYFPTAFMCSSTSYRTRYGRIAKICGSVI